MLIISFIMLIFVLLTPIKKRIYAKAILDNARVGLTLLSLEIIKDYPVIGTGFGLQTFDKVIDQQTYNKKIPKKHQIAKHANAPHNMFFSVAMRMGVIGLGLFLYIIGVAVRICLKLLNGGRNDFIRAWSLCALSVLTMFLIKGFFSPVFNHFTEVVFYTIFSMITILWQINKDPDIEDQALDNP